MSDEREKPVHPWIDPRFHEAMLQEVLEENERLHAQHNRNGTPEGTFDTLSGPYDAGQAAHEARSGTTGPALDELTEAITALVREGIFEGIANGLQEIIDAQEQPEPKRPTANEIIANYYRARALWPKLTLAKYLRQIGESHREGYIRKAKSGYDKQHKRGKLG